MTVVPLLSAALPAVLAVVLACCAAAPLEDAAERAADEAALADGWPDGAAVVVVENGAVRVAESLREVFDAPSATASRFVFRPGEDGDRSLTVAYLPAHETVAGDGFLAAIGAELRSDARRQLALVRDLRSAPAASDRTVALTLGPPERTLVPAEVVRVTLDPDARGTLLLPRALALRLGAARFAIPGTTHVDVALGRPFTAQRARLRAEIPELGIDTLVEIAYEAPPPEARP